MNRRGRDSREAIVLRRSARVVPGPLRTSDRHGLGDSDGGPYGSSAEEHIVRDAIR